MLAIEVLLQSLLVFTAHWTHCSHIEGVVDACFGLLLPEELDGVQARVLVQPYSQHGAPRHSGHDRERVVKFVACHKAFSVALRSWTSFVSRSVEVILLNTELKNLDDWQNQVLVDKFLRQLHFQVKHGYRIIILHIEVLMIEEGIFLSAFCNLESRDLLFLRVLLNWAEDDWFFLRGQFGLGCVALLQAL